MMVIIISFQKSRGGVSVSARKTKSYVVTQEFEKQPWRGYDK
jgi:hypothetical protein